MEFSKGFEGYWKKLEVYVLLSGSSGVFSTGAKLGGEARRGGEEEERQQGSAQAGAASHAVDEEDLPLVTPSNRHPNAKPCYGRLVDLLLQPLPEQVRGSRWNASSISCFFAGLPLHIMPGRIGVVISDVLDRWGIFSLRWGILSGHLNLQWAILSVEVGHLVCSSGASCLLKWGVLTVQVGHLVINLRGDSNVVQVALKCGDLVALLGLYEAAANFQRVAEHLVERVADGPGGDEAFVRQAMSVAAACLSKLVKALAASVASRTVGTGWLSFDVSGMGALLSRSLRPAYLLVCLLHNGWGSKEIVFKLLRVLACLDSIGVGAKTASA